MGYVLDRGVCRVYVVGTMGVKCHVGRV